MRHFRVWAALLAFPVTYAALYEATNWGAVYLLDRWDPKWGKSGSIQLGHELMPLFVAVSVVSYALGAAAYWRSLRVIPPKRVFAASIGAAFLAESVPFIFNLATRHIYSESLTAIGLTLLVIGPAAFAATAFAIATRHRPVPNQS